MKFNINYRYKYIIIKYLIKVNNYLFIYYKFFNIY